MKKLNNSCREFLTRSREKYDIDFADDSLVLRQLERLIERLKSKPGDGKSRWTELTSAFVASWLVRLGGGTIETTDHGIVVRTPEISSNVSEWIAKLFRFGVTDLIEDKISVHLLSSTRSQLTSTAKDG